jgi:hypothetical protein
MSARPVIDDRALDRALAAITSAEAPADLRDGVLRRLQEQDESERAAAGAWSPAAVPWLGRRVGIAAAAASLALALFAWWDWRTPSLVEPQRVATPRVIRPASGPQERVPPPTLASAAPASDTHQRLKKARWFPGQEEELDPLPLLDPIRTREVAPTEMRVTPLEIEAVDVGEALDVQPLEGP